MSDVFHYVDEPDGFMREHFLDPADDAESLMILLEERVAEVQAREVEPEPLTRRELDEMTRRYDESRRWAS